VDPSAFTNVSLEPYTCNAPGIANVTTQLQYTGQIVRSFLAGTTAWTTIGTTPATDVYLTTDGGTFFGMINGAGAQVTDISQVYWGTLQLQIGGVAGSIFFNDFTSGTGDFEVTSSSLGTVDCGTVTEAIGYFAAARCKIATAIISVGPLATTLPRILNSGQNITITGADFGYLCNGCKVVATPTGGSGVSLSVSSWSTTSIVAALPASLSGLVNIGVFATTGNDGINIMVASPAATAPAISVAPTTLSFSSVNGATPATHTFEITNTGSGALAWTATSSATWLTLSSASGTAPFTVTASINPAGLAIGTYNGTIQVTASGATGSPVAISVTLTVQGTQTGGGSITGVVNSGSFAAGIAPDTWVSIFGSNLASTTYTWQASDFNNGQLPTTLQGVSVTIDGKPAYVEYVSPTQINVLAPTDSVIGPVSVQASLNQQTSNVVNAQLQQFAPAFFAGSGSTIAAEHSDYSLVTASSPARPGEVVLLFGTGFGLTNPALPPGQLVGAPSPLANQVQISVGGATANVQYSGLIGPGLYQFNVAIPATATTGSAAVVATINGIQSQTGVTIPVQQ
jgi:uncharacterized protein (TIGR03437 family)